MNDQAADERQQAQEVEYLVPYHWFWKPDSESGRSYFAYLDMVAKRIPVASKRLVDIGCGDGRGTAFLKDQRPGLSVSGLDYSERALQLAAMMSSPREIFWARFNAYEGFDASMQKFEVATCIEMLEHLPQEKLECALQNIRGLLIDGGTLILTVPSILAHRPVKHYQHFTQATMTNALEKSGFRVECCDGQEDPRHWLFTIYRFADNRWWTIKPLMRWFNTSVYPKKTSPCAQDKSNRLVFVARAV